MESMLLELHDLPLLYLLLQFFWPFAYINITILMSLYPAFRIKNYGYHTQHLALCDLLLFSM